MNLAGDNLIVDLDLHEGNVPPGTRLRIGEVVLEVTDVPHTGCSKFERRYGKAALDLTNTPEGSAMHLRGVLARVIQGGRCGLATRSAKKRPRLRPSDSSFAHLDRVMHRAWHSGRRP